MSYSFILVNLENFLNSELRLVVVNISYIKLLHMTQCVSSVQQITCTHVYCVCGSMQCCRIYCSHMQFTCGYCTYAMLLSLCLVTNACLCVVCVCIMCYLQLCHEQFYTAEIALALEHVHSLEIIYRYVSISTQTSSHTDRTYMCVYTLYHTCYAASLLRSTHLTYTPLHASLRMCVN